MKKLADASAKTIPMLHPLKKLLLVAGCCALPLTAVKAQFLSVTVAPPPLPVYVQPPCPVEGYLWTPGYWGYADEDFYWVPGAWVEPPRIGYLWTPGYWGFDDGLYAFHTGYWGPTVGFYGGVNYGCGYGGYGYGGGRWDGGRFRYNTAVTRVNTTIIRNTYVNRSVLNERATNSRASFNGPGGVRLRPTAQQQRLAQSARLRPTEAQVARRQDAARDRGQFASVNRGRPERLTVGAPARREGLQERAERPPGRAAAGGQMQGEAPARQARRLESREAGLQRPFNAERRAERGDGLLPEERPLAERREARMNRNMYREQSERGVYGGPAARPEMAMRREQRPDFRRTEGMEARRDMVASPERTIRRQEAGSNPYGPRGGEQFAPPRTAEAHAQARAERQQAREGSGQHERREHGERGERGERSERERF